MSQQTDHRNKLDELYKEANRAEYENNTEELRILDLKIARMKLEESVLKIPLNERLTARQKTIVDRAMVKFKPRKEYCSDNTRLELQS